MKIDLNLEWHKFPDEYPEVDFSKRFLVIYNGFCIAKFVPHCNTKEPTLHSGDDPLYNGTYFFPDDYKKFLWAELPDDWEKFLDPPKA